MRNLIAFPSDNENAYHPRLFFLNDEINYQIDLLRLKFIYRGY
jgi:hypothetical protein